MGNNLDIRLMSGCEILQAIRDGKMDPPTMSQTMPMELIEVEPGRVLFHAKADARHINPLGAVHGGFAATVLDAATGCAVHSMLDAGVGFGTVELDVKMMRPVPVDKKLIADGKLLSLTRSIGFAEGTLRDEGGKMFAHATATCMVIR
jgi:uncharacterized protein (TIGR00369 family)